MIKFTAVRVRKHGAGTLTRAGRSIMKLMGECISDGGEVNLDFHTDGVRINSDEYCTGTLTWRTKRAQATRHRRSKRRTYN